MYAFIKSKKNRKLLVISISLFIFLFSSGMLVYSYLVGKNEPEVKMVSGTEYVSGEQGQVIVRVNDRVGEPIRNAICRATVLYPDKGYFLIDYPMVESTTPGNYYATFTTPIKEGIYEETITCTFISSNNENLLKISSSFHVSKALNYVVNMSNVQDLRYAQIMDRINYIEGSLINIKNDVNDSKGYVEEKISNIDNTVQNKFDSLYSNMAQASQAMADIYGGGNSG
jgi:flagellar basal body-associated protein FliL